MDDSGEEGEVKEYFTSPGEEECKRKASWILSKGLQLGKTILITGVVISSAPVVLPPLVVVSAVGFAVSIPAGVVVASYACTEKLMNKFLPMPASSPELEIETGLLDKAEKEESEFGGEFLPEEELEKQIADTKEVEMRTESGEDGKKEQHVEGHEEPKEQKLYKDESFKEKGYEEDVGEYLEGEDDRSLGGQFVKILGVEKVDKEPLIEERKDEKPSAEIKRVVVVTVPEKKNADDVTKTDEVVIIARGTRTEIKNVEMVTRNDEDKALRQGTTGDLEKIRDKGDIGESVKKNKKKNKHHGKKSHGVGGKKEHNHRKTTKEMNEKLNKQFSEKGEKTIADAKRGSAEATGEGSTTEKVDVDDRSSVLASHRLIGDQGTLTNGNRAAESCKTVGVELKPGAVTQGSGVDSNVSDEKEVNAIESNTETRETAIVWSPEKGAKEKNLDFVENQVQVFPKSRGEAPISSNEGGEDVGADKCNANDSWIQSSPSVILHGGTEGFIHLHWG
ncbi:caldesmon-like isoform X3 [Coffea eugenioides]|uniref:caldesmon-like isoform X3 n=1 Tax=Coffea eugenioides TaxID=49369 RepID=UPI000F60BA31|nr:caldesmon-like isoform X3 [Coffea eugenioides]